MSVLVLLAALAWPAAGTAEHVDIEAAVSARVAERSPSGSWVIAVEYEVRCLGAGPRGASYTGNLNLVDEKTGERIYLGGVSSAKGSVRQIVSPQAVWRRLRPELKVSCWDDASVHGAGPIEVAGGVAVVPARDGDGEGGVGGGGGGSGGSAGNDPTEPTRDGGCRIAIVGTDEADVLTGGGAGEVVFGRGGNDTIRAGGGHDCLSGGAGNDVLRGEAGDDRLTGGRGADTLVGGPGVNVYDAGSGNDVVDAKNGRAELVRCGPGRDTARLDRTDRSSGCERKRA